VIDYFKFRFISMQLIRKFLIALVLIHLVSSCSDSLESQEIQYKQDCLGVSFGSVECITKHLNIQIAPDEMSLDDINKHKNDLINCMGNDKYEKLINLLNERISFYDALKPNIILRLFFADTPYDEPYSFMHNKSLASITHKIVSIEEEITQKCNNKKASNKITQSSPNLSQTTPAQNSTTEISEPSSVNVEQLTQNPQILEDFQIQKAKEELAKYKAKDALDEANKQINIVWNAATKNIRKKLLPEQKEWLNQRENNCGLKASNEEPNNIVLQETIKLSCMTTITNERTEVLKQEVTKLQLSDNQLQKAPAVTLDKLFLNIKKCEFNNFYYEPEDISRPYFSERNLKPYKEYQGIYYFKISDSLFGLPVSELIVPGTWNYHQVTFDAPLAQVREVIKKKFGSYFAKPKKYDAGYYPILEQDSDNPNKSIIYCDEKEIG